MPQRRAGFSVTYALLVNLREAASDTGVHKIYREFFKANEGTLRLCGPIRFVLLEAVEFSTLLKRLDDEDVLACRSDLLARAFDDIHESLMGEKIPVGDDWMAERMISLIFQAEPVPVESLFPAPRAVE